ncbi:nuclear transport factor 2 family protein [Pimelobacter simplex]|uniref:nuclear transport factor 2 family protein n=1 Tax=Nocardioides simplex TaxID=2045 RepID=UPI00214FC8D2|nr:nuclear transport factor 2 family protein [Pimelobacter simplex]UUW91427.1 nuclear transport factor 2 family protein [Pimelobacter simplex]UUW95255.1 nuclear transport factor 2 family protein [Pimelobacter simplex]
MTELDLARVDELEQQLLDGLMAADTAALERLYAADRRHIHYDGRREENAEYLAPVREGAVRYTRIEPYGERHVALAGSTAVITGDLAWTAEFPDGSTAEGLIAYSSVWADRGHGPEHLLWHSSPTPRTPA